MTVYHGIVKDNAISLPEEVHLDDGTEVEVTIVLASVHEQVTQESLEKAEEAFNQRLLEKDLLAEIKKPPLVEPQGDRTSIKVKGTPLSQMIINDNRGSEVRYVA